MISTNDYLLKVENLKTYFPIKKGLLRRTIGYVKAVDGVSFKIKSGQTFGLVGQSGCGKTTVARSIVRLAPVTAGKVIFKQMDVLSANRVNLTELRRQIGLVFQDPYGSLNPRMTIGDIVGEPLKVQKKIAGSELVERVAELLSKVGLSPGYTNRYPHEFSAGQRQRIGLARALALEPKLIICDEPVSALDVSIQAQILNLLKDLQEEFKFTFLFIAHDLAVVEFFCDIVAVMYMGRIVEQAMAQELYRNPLHPYTRMLISSIPEIELGQEKSKNASGVSQSQRDKRTVLDSGVPNASAPLTGCPFYPRCLLRRSDCLKQMPSLKEKSHCKGHFVACWKC